MPCSFFPSCEIEPSCFVQLSPSSATLPKRVCEEMARQTVDSFLSGVPIRPEMDTGGFSYAWEWPAPIGEASIAASRAQQLAVTRETQEHYGYTPSWLKTPDEPLLDCLDDALVGLVVQRNLTQDGRVIARITLFGLVEPTQADRGKQPGTPDLFRSLGMEFGRSAYRHVEPVLKSEYLGTQKKEAQAVERQVLAWYRKYILGTLLRPGRPPGSLEAFRSKDDFCATLRAAVFAISARGEYASAERVAEYLWADGRLTSRRGEGEDPARQLRRYSRAFGFNSWSEVLIALR